MESGGGKWALTEIAHGTQLVFPHKKGNMDGNVSLEQQHLQAHIREEQLQRRAENAERRAEKSERRVEYLEKRAEEFKRRAEESERRAIESEGRADAAEERVHNLERSLADSTQNLRQCEFVCMIYLTKYSY